MDPQPIIEVEILADDWARISEALETQGLDPAADLPWLLAFGLDRFMRDEREWQSGGAGPSDDPRRQELKRRETEALLVSMRARTIRAEMQMHDLSERVHSLGGVLKENRRRMRRLRDENSALQDRIDHVQSLLDSSPPPEAAAPGAAARLRAWLGRASRRWSGR